MPTDNPKISSYVPQQIYDRFKKFQKEKELTMSQAVILILAEYFGIEETIKENNSGSPVGGVTISAFQQLIDEVKNLKQKVEYLESTFNPLNEQDIDQGEELKIIEDEDKNSQLNLLSELSSKSLEIMGKSLAIRLGVSPSKITTAKSDMTMNDFIEWSSTKDPDSIGWSYRDKTRHEGKGVLYFPSEQLNSELNSKLLEWITDNVK